MGVYSILNFDESLQLILNQPPWMKSDFRESLEERFAAEYHQIYTSDFRYLLSKKGYGRLS